MSGRDDLKPGDRLRKLGRGGEVLAEATVVDGGFDYKGTVYKSISPAAMQALRDLGKDPKAVNGWAFFADVVRADGSKADVTAPDTRQRDKVRDFPHTRPNDNTKIAAKASHPSSTAVETMKEQLLEQFPEIKKHYEQLLEQFPEIKKHYGTPPDPDDDGAPVHYCYQGRDHGVAACNSSLKPDPKHRSWMRAFATCPKCKKEKAE